MSENDPRKLYHDAFRAHFRTYWDADGVLIDPKEWTPERLMKNAAGEYKRGRPGDPGMEGFSIPDLDPAADVEPGS